MKFKRCAPLCGLVVLVLLSALMPVPGHAETPTRAPAQAVIDRIDLEPSPLWGSDRLRILFSEVSVQGAIVDVTAANAIRLMVGSNEKKPPMVLGRFGKTDLPLAIAIVAESSIEFSEVAPLVRDNVQTQLVSIRPANTQWLMVRYSDTVSVGKFVSGKAIGNQLDQLSNDGSTGDPALLEAIERALVALKKIKPSNTRKMIIVIGDGRDRENDRTRVTAMGERAAKENVRIHTIGFAASGARRPLLVLGELSKKSLGTFRWVRTEKAESWQPVFAQLAAEIANQYVLTYYVPAGEFAGKKLHIATTGTFELASNEAKVPQARCGDLTCSTSQACIAGRCSTLAPGVKRQFGRAVLFAVGGFGVLIVLLAGVRALKKLATPTPAPAPTMAQAHGSATPGQVDPNAVANQLAAPAKPQKTMVVQIAATASSPPPAGSNARPTPDRGATAAAPARPAAPIGPPPATLYVLSGAHNGQRVPLHNGFMIGRGPGCHLVLDDHEIELQHAEIQLDGYGNSSIVDRNSRSGTFVGGTRVRSAALIHGSSIRIGNTDLRYLAE
ncbi:MAG: FHA domain-containing protein [Kofleriaceae bacterium]|nr:FHA domain-containing protein [Kofleriaceae bacterium]